VIGAEVGAEIAPVDEVVEVTPAADLPAGAPITTDRREEMVIAADEGAEGAGHLERSRLHKEEGETNEVEVVTGTEIGGGVITRTSITITIFISFALL